MSVVDPQLFRSFCFRGEGRANFVVSAKCGKSGLRIVWRLAKKRKSGTVSVKPKCHLVIAYMEKLIVPILGRQFLVKPKIVQVDVQALHHLAKIPSLPLNLKVEMFDDLCDGTKFPSSMSFFPRTVIPDGMCYVSALQMLDATRIPKRLPPQFFGPTITVEIKPKQGFFQKHAGVHIPYCNNCILQIEKCSSDAFDQMYDYCPLDLFSGDLERMRHAINSLIAVPHRNLRIFLDGTVIHSDEIQLGTDQLSETLFHDSSVTMEQLVTAICCVLVGASSEDPFMMHSSSVLAKLLAAQCIDTIGIVRAHEIYANLPENDQKELLDKCLLPQKGLSFLQKNTDRALIERYLLAATMKDCSLMISLRLVDPIAFTNPNTKTSGQQIVRVAGLGDTEAVRSKHPPVSFAFSIKIVDLDPKSPKNLINAYERFMRGVKLIERTSNLRRPCMVI